ncbi:MAG: glycosyltransferase [Patescibacteria group bacterium]
MKITIVCPDSSSNSMGRGYILAQMLHKYYTVEIVAIDLSGTNSLWKPIQDATDIPITIVPFSGRRIQQILEKIDGDVIYAIKPIITSYGIGLLKSYVSGKKIVLDEDDWDFGNYYDRSLIQRLHQIIDVKNPYNLYLIFVLSKLSFLAHAVTVSSPFLQQRFGGTIIPHARNEALFDVNSTKVSQLQSTYNPDNKQIVLFLGTVRRHKGIDDIVAAMDKLNRNNLILMLVGVDDEAQALIPNRHYIVTIPPQPFHELAAYLALGTVVVLAQKPTAFSAGQTPAKLFDAMAAKRPIIASKIGWTAKLLKGCGRTFEPGNTAELAKEIASVLDDPIYAQKLATNARKLYEERFSYTVVANQLKQVFDSLSQKLKDECNQEHIDKRD